MTLFAIGLHPTFNSDSILVREFLDRNDDDIMCNLVRGDSFCLFRSISAMTNLGAALIIQYEDIAFLVNGTVTIIVFSHLKHFLCVCDRKFAFEQSQNILFEAFQNTNNKIDYFDGNWRAPCEIQNMREIFVRFFLVWL